MSSCLHRPTRTLRAFRRLWADDCASQIVEFALSLPLLVLFVVGIFDFSGAISLKQKLTNAAREAARVAAADPASDLGSPSSAQPASVLDAFYVVDNYLISEKINDCGLATPTVTQSALTWTYTASGGGCPGTGISLQINRGCVKTQAISGNTVNLVGTCVTITYPYKWQYSSVTGLLGITFIGPTGITTTASAFNEN
ncbi:MAG: TadE/TadG family type IV pilus assembly protein [Candidatus Sulfotelmatobacter sp.]|jgi:Flp pilus assembly protein TadG